MGRSRVDNMYMMGMNRVDNFCIINGYVMGRNRVDNLA